MRKTVVVALTAVALILGFTAIASAAGKPAYVVTLKASTTSSTAGKLIVVAGKVTGPNAAGRSVTIQRKYVDGGWTSVAFATIKDNGNFSARVETPRGGTTSFRALKAKSSVRSAGVSPTRSTKVWQWLYLTNQPSFTNHASPFEETIDGKLYKHSFSSSQDGGLTYKTNGLCTTFTTRINYTKGSLDSDDAVNIEATKSPVGGPPVTTNKPVSTGTPVTFTSSVAGGKYFEFDWSDIPVSGAYFIAFGDPKVYCNAPELPTFNGSDV